MDKPIIISFTTFYFSLFCLQYSIYVIILRTLGFSFSIYVLVINHFPILTSCLYFIYLFIY